MLKSIDHPWEKDALAKVMAKFDKTKEHLISFAERAREEGVLALEAFIYNNPDLQKDYSLLCDGVGLVVDGTETENIEQFFDSVALLTDSLWEKAYVGMVKLGVCLLNGGGNPKFIKRMLDESFDFDRKVL